MEHRVIGYPANLRIEYSSRSSRLTVLFRLLLALPILLLLGLLVNSGNYGQHGEKIVRYVGAPGFVFLPTVLMLVLRRKYPRWWFDWNLALLKFVLRVSAYFMCLRDEYPSTDEDQAVHVDIPYPNAAELNRWLPLVKWFLALPHLVVLACLWVASILISVVAWFAILITGRYPRSLFAIIVGVARWSIRVCAYAALLTTDVYPPFDIS